MPTHEDFDQPVEPGNFLVDGKNVYEIEEVQAGGKAVAQKLKLGKEIEKETRVVVNIGKCKNCINRNQLGQLQRFTPGGTGFSKQGRKIQKNYSKHIDEIRQIREKIEQVL